jgi:hypothetical protein
MTASRMAAAAAFAVIVCSAADARWKPEYGDHPPEVQAWYKQQHNARGEWCCNESDGHPFYGDYSINEDGSVTLHIDGKARVLPSYMVLKGPNPTGHAVWWYLDVGTTHRDYCFAPGTLS